MGAAQHKPPLQSRWLFVSTMPDSQRPQAVSNLPKTDCDLNKFSVYLTQGQYALYSFSLVARENKPAPKKNDLLKKRPKS